MQNKLREVFRVGLFIYVFLFASSCCKNNEPFPLQNNVVLSEATKIGSHTATELKALVALSGYNLSVPLKYDVDV